MFRSKLFTIHFTILFKILNHFTILKNCYENFSEAVVRRCSVKNFANVTGIYLCQGLFFQKRCRPQSTTLLKKRLWHSCFTKLRVLRVNFAKFLRTPFFIEHIRWLLLTFSNEFSLKLSYIPRPPTLLKAGLH